MTKEELKEHCKRQVECCEMWARNNGGEPHGKVYEEHKLVLDLINTLEQSGEDCVSREQALLALTGTNLGEKSADELIALFDKRMRALPPVTPTQRWIPVSERLPEESGNYLLYGKVVDYEENCVFIGEYDSDHEMFGYEENIYDSETLGFVDSEFCEYNKVIAWQPLPKPYEEKRGNENEIN